MSFQLNSKAQSSLEYITIFGVSFALFVIVIWLVSNFETNPIEQPSSCYISPELNCIQAVVATNSVASEAVIMFTNNMGLPIQFAANSFDVVPTVTASSYLGECFPTNAMPNQIVYCNATLSQYSPRIGDQVVPTFKISFTQCFSSNQCMLDNISGTSTTYVSPISKALLVTGVANHIVQFTSNSVPTGSPILCQFSSPIRAGDIIIVGTTVSNPSGPASLSAPSDRQGDPFNQDPNSKTSFGSGGANTAVGLWYGISSGGSISISIHYNGAQAEIFCYDLTAVSSTGTTSSSGGGTSTSTSVTSYTPQSGSVVISAVAAVNSPGGSLVAGAGYTGDNSDSYSLAEHLYPSSGSITSPATVIGSGIPPIVWAEASISIPTT